MTAEELWKEAVKGSQEAWKQLYFQFGQQIYNFFLKNTCDQELAKDKSQEVFERLYRHRESFFDGNLKTWIFRIARNLLIDYWRKKGKNIDLFGDDPPQIPDPVLNLEEDVINRLTHDEMVKLIDKTLPLLNEDDRLVIGLVYLGGLTISELAQVMEVPLGTAKTRVRRARLELDRLLTESIKGQYEAQGV